MNAFLGELSARKPYLEITPVESSRERKDKYLQEVCGEFIPGEDRAKYRKEEKSFSGLGKELRKGYDLKGFGSRVFSDTLSVRTSTVEYIAINSFKALSTSCLTDPETMPGPGEYFTPRELYYLWVSDNLVWASGLRYPGYESPFTRLHGRGILEKVVEDADAAIAKQSPVAATLRFSHDTYLFPVMTAIPLEGTFLTCEDRQIAEYFQNYRFVCPACNVQMIFYRKGNHDKGRILVKFLLNEKETLIYGLKPTKGVYYDWSAVKKFWNL